MNNTVSSETDLKLIPLPPIHVLRSHLAIIEQMATFLQMSVEEITRMALVELSRKPIFDNLFRHSKSSYDEKDTK